MRMRLNYKMASTSSNKIKQEFKEYIDGKQDQKDTS